MEHNNADDGFWAFCKSADEAVRALRGLSAERTPEPAAPTGALALGPCSLPVSSAEALCVEWELECKMFNEWRNKALESRQYGWASRYEDIIDAYSRCVKDLRREMVAATERQPEENADDERRA